MKTRITATLLLATAALVACQTSHPMVDEIIASGARQVVGADLRALHANKTHYSTYSGSNTAWVEYHDPDGRALYRGRGRPEPGTWEISDDQVCYSYDWMEDDRQFCFEIYLMDGRYYGVNANDTNGNPIGTVGVRLDDVRTGDTEGLGEPRRQSVISSSWSRWPAQFVSDLI